MGLLDILFPKRCVSCRSLGSYLCANCFAFLSFDTADICLICNRAAMDGLTHPGCQTRTTIDGAFASLAYNKVVKKLVYSFKYQPFVADLQSILIDFFYEGIIQKEHVHTLLKTDPLFVPIPLHVSKLRKRGYNQAEILSRGLSTKLGLKTENLLKRTRNTSSQFNLSREDRQKNISRAFSLINADRTKIQNRVVFLIDDVFTSGATVVEAAKVLKKSGAKRVYGLALAHGQ